MVACTSRCAVIDDVSFSCPLNGLRLTIDRDNQVSRLCQWIHDMYNVCKASGLLSSSRGELLTEHVQRSPPQRVDKNHPKHESLSTPSRRDPLLQLRHGVNVIPLPEVSQHLENQLTPMSPD